MYQETTVDCFSLQLKKTASAGSLLSRLPLVGQQGKRLADGIAHYEGAAAQQAQQAISEQAAKAAKKAFGHGVAPGGLAGGIGGAVVGGVTSDDKAKGIVQGGLAGTLLGYGLGGARSAMRAHNAVATELGEKALQQAAGREAATLRAIANSVGTKDAQLEALLAGAAKENAPSHTLARIGEQLSGTSPGGLFAPKRLSEKGMDNLLREIGAVYK